MNKDRIQINGVWYVPEQTNSVSFDHNLVTFFNGCVFENKTSCFEVNHLTDNEGVVKKDTLSIEYTDKRPGNIKDWKIDYWDNEKWIRNVADGITVGLEDLSEEDRMELVQFLGYLKKIDWL